MGRRSEGRRRRGKRKEGEEGWVRKSRESGKGEGKG